MEYQVFQMGLKKSKDKIKKELLLTIEQELRSLLIHLGNLLSLAEIKISTINQPEPITLKVFPSIENQPFNLIVDDSGELMIIDRHRLAQILVNQVDFQAKD